jgi:ELWxxDGT repeat protein
LIEDQFSSYVEKPSDITSYSSEVCLSGMTRLDRDALLCIDGGELDQEASVSASGFIFYDNQLFFNGDNELYRFDGTSAALVEDIDPSSRASPSDFARAAVGTTTELFFAADGPDGRELYVYDGSQASLVDDINGSGDSNPRELTRFGSSIYFSADGGTDGTELWRYNGGSSATQVEDINSGSDSGVPYNSFPSDFAVYNDGSSDNLYFSAQTEAEGDELWVYDSFDGTVSQVQDINSGSANSNPSGLTVYDDGTSSGRDLYFGARGAIDGSELWRFDGSAASQAVDINPGSAGSGPRYLTVFDDGGSSGRDLYFSADDDANGTPELWRYESGTSAANVTPAFFVELNELSTAGSALYFGARKEASNSALVPTTKLWRYNGSFSQPQFTNNLVGGPGEKVVYDGTLYFNGESATGGAELWRLDGGGVALEDDVNGISDNGSNPNDFTVYAGDLYFEADAPSTGQELYLFDGFGTARVTDLDSGSDDASPQNLITYDDGTASGTDLYFEALTSITGGDLWRYDASADATQELGRTGGIAETIVYDDGGPSGPDLYYFTENSIGRYDSGSSPSKVVDICSDCIANPTDPVVYDGILYFGAEAGGTGSGNGQLWGFNGTTLDQKSSFSDSGSPSGLTVYDGELFFAGGGDRELYRFDASGGSVQRVKDINAGAEGSSPEDLTVFGGQLYFTARDGTSGREPYAYDGSEVRSADVNPGAPSGGGVDPVTYDDGSGTDLYVTATNGTSGLELFRFTESTGPLPVELAALEGTQLGRRSAQLSWTTASEASNAGFAVQHQGPQATGWEKVGFVESKASGGTTAEATRYQHEVSGLAVGTHRFRLRQVDLDGSAEVHGPVTVELKMQQSLRLSAPAPNPVRERATLSFAVKDPRETSVTLYNVLGQQVRTLYRGTPPAGQAQTARLETAALPSGTYLIRLQAGAKTQTQRVTVVK